MSRLVDRLLRSVGLARLKRRSAWAGAQGSRLTGDWIFSATQSADDELKGEILTLRNRARDLGRNDPVIAHWLDYLPDNVVGPTGVKFDPRVWVNDAVDRDASLALWEAWGEWGTRGACTRDGRLSFAEVERLAVRQTEVDGEAFVEMIPTASSEYGLQVQLVDPDLVDHQYNLQPAAGKPWVVMGVELDTITARPIAYHVWTDYTRRTRRRVPAEWMLHMFRQLRPGQTRGVTGLAPAMILIKMLNGLREAEVVASRAAASKMAFLIPGETSEFTEPSDGGTTIPVETSAGSLETLPPGYDVKSFAPDHPNTAFIGFSKSLQRDIAVSLGTNYVSLTGDLEATSYSSMRGGLMAERDRFRVWQSLLIDAVCDPLARRWLELGLLKGALELPRGVTAADVQFTWTPRRWAWVDPESDLAAAEQSLALGLTSRTQLAAETGGDFEENLIQMQREAELLAEYGVTLPAMPGKGMPDGNGQGDGAAGAGDRPMAPRGLDTWQRGGRRNGHARPVERGAG